jgi:hypothetical protein
MPDFMRREFEILYDRFCKLYSEAERRESVFLFTLNIAESPSVRSSRKSHDQFFFESMEK